jgi:hypothetical protein
MFDHGEDWYMFVLVCINNCSEKGEAILCSTKKEGKELLKCKYKEKVKTTIPLNEENTYISKGGCYAVVCDYLKIIEYRLIEIV